MNPVQSFRAFWSLPLEGRRARVLSHPIAWGIGFAAFFSLTFMPLLGVFTGRPAVQIFVGMAVTFGAGVIATPAILVRARRQG